MSVAMSVKTIYVLYTMSFFIRNPGLFVVLLLNVPVNIYGHVGTVISEFVGLLPDIEMNNSKSPCN